MGERTDKITNWPRDRSPGLTLVDYAPCFDRDNRPGPNFDRNLSQKRPSQKSGFSFPIKVQVRSACQGVAYTWALRADGSAAAEQPTVDVPMAGSRRQWLSACLLSNGMRSGRALGIASRGVGRAGN